MAIVLRMATVWPPSGHRLATVATFALAMLTVVVATLARAWTQPHLRSPRFFHRLATVATLAFRYSQSRGSYARQSVEEDWNEPILVQ